MLINKLIHLSFIDKNNFNYRKKTFVPKFIFI